MRKATILLVGDGQSILRSVSANLRRQEYEVVTASDGLHALTLMEETMADLLVLDVTMPGMNGFEVCRRVREWSSVPIIMLSAVLEEQEKVKSLRLGADDYLVKPL